MSAPLLSLLFSLLFLGACSTAYSPYAYDDTYYSPGNDPIKKVQVDPRQEFNKTDNIHYDGSSPNRYSNKSSSRETMSKDAYNNRYVETENNENNSTSDDYVPSNNNDSEYYNDDTEYYDDNYSNNTNNLYTPVRSFNTYDPYVQDRIIYTNNPYFASPSLYGSYNFWNPYSYGSGLSLGYNSYSG